MSKVTGFGGCVSVIGPLLGGGHGILQGRYGLAADNIVSARLVLGNGTAIDVSESSNPELFWAVRGAGHNFGVVSSFEMKTYDVPEDDQWTFLDFVYTWDQLEEVLDVVNAFTEEGAHPEELVILGAIARSPPLDPENVSG
jgi:FAD/FMN-containing dehydrogenase